MALGLQQHPGMRSFLFGLPLVVLSHSAVHADDSTDVQVGLASEHGAGIGLGVELGDVDTRFVSGLGVAFGFGYSSIDGWVGAMAPGVGLGLRHYLGSWYLGPTVGANYSMWASPDERGLGTIDTWTVWGAVDVGHRWAVGAGGDWSIKLGLSGGLGREQGEAGTKRLLGLTFTVGR